MLYKTMLLAFTLAAVPVLPQAGNVDAFDSEAEPQPGVIRLAGITGEDVVSLDGEEIPAEGLRRSRYTLLVAPGIYTLQVQYAASGKICTSRVVVAENRTVEPSCGRRGGDQLAD